MGSPLAGFPPNKEIQFLMISPKLLDISHILLTDIFSSLNSGMLLGLPGDGYSLLCSKKQPLRHNVLCLKREMLKFFDFPRMIRISPVNEKKCIFIIILLNFSARLSFEEYKYGVTYTYLRYSLVLCLVKR